MPHFSQVWFFLTPPADAAVLGMLGESFPGNRRAASEVTQTNMAAHGDVLTGESLCSSCQHCQSACLCFSFVSSIGQQPPDTLHECSKTGYYLEMKDCYYYLDIFAPPFIEAENAGHVHSMISIRKSPSQAHLFCTMHF